jgi:hypothetical protein
MKMAKGGCIKVTCSNCGNEWKISLMEVPTQNPIERQKGLPCSEKIICPKCKHGKTPAEFEVKVR